MYVITDKCFSTSSVNCINWSVSLCRVESVLLPNKVVDQKMKNWRLTSSMKTSLIALSIPKNNLYSDSMRKAVQLPALECEVSLACLTVSHSLLNKWHWNTRSLCRSSVMCGSFNLLLLKNENNKLYKSRFYIWNFVYCCLLQILCFLFLDFLTKFSPECVEWKLNGIPCVTVNIHILTLNCFSCSDAIAFLNL